MVKPKAQGVRQASSVRPYNATGLVAAHSATNTWDSAAEHSNSMQAPERATVSILQTYGFTGSLYEAMEANTEFSR